METVCLSSPSRLPRFGADVDAPHDFVAQAQQFAPAFGGHTTSYASAWRAWDI